MSYSLSTFRSLSTAFLLAGMAHAQAAPDQAPRAPAASPPPAPAPTAPAPAPGPPAASPAPAPAVAPAPAASPAPAPAAAPAPPPSGPPTAEATPAAGDAAPAAAATTGGASEPPSPEAAPATEPPAASDAAPEEPVRGPRVLAAPPAPPEPPEPVVLGDAAGRLELALGFGLNWLGDQEYDLFATSDVLPLASLRAGMTFWQSGRWSALGVLGVQYGGTSAAARGTRTHLDLGRTLLGVEARAHVLSGVVGYGRLLGGAALVAARVGPSGDPASASMLAPAAAIEGALGAAVRLYGSKNGPARSFRLEAYLEGGFDFVSDVDLALEVGPGGPPRPEPLELGVLSASGALFGLGLQGSY